MHGAVKEFNLARKYWVVYSLIIGVKREGALNRECALITLNTVHICYNTLRKFGSSDPWVKLVETSVKVPTY